jgi:hypothetical protein
MNFVETALVIHLGINPKAHSKNPLKRVEIPVIISLQSILMDLSYEPWD